ncbi:hypothetical protein DS2_19156 [Catenovulum agarivorans DS-2]|uniref:Uncharacterized protein n=1 Tax=Catenovulum agarivorans DS-2 TaxID=1328313 RepID=W7QRS2_9ALTE|nr:hypothetical protein [Catenovulum agarivorans]EWH08085.1 hypothetical protein DS2_19156 [Catenovulum agarivorans DS-2]
MIIIESAHHIVESKLNKKPSLVCKGICKSVHWHDTDANQPQVLVLPKCEICGGNLKLATENIDYKVLELAITNEEFGFNKISRIKPEFIKFAEKTWLK